MSSSSHDKDLKRAIALSLQESTTGGTGVTAREAISLDSDSETEKEPASTANLTEATDCATPRVGIGLLGLDRKQMEQERLARKRKALSISPPPPRKTVAKSRPLAIVPTKETPMAVLQAAAVPEATSAYSGEGPVFLEGIVKKTWAFGHERKGDDIKMEEVLQKHDLGLAVLSSFQWDMDWLLAKIHTRSTNLTLIMQAKDQSTQQQYLRETAAMPNLRLCFPSMEGQINCMHSKLMLLSHPDHLRVAVPTANLVSYDWGETGTVRICCRETRLVRTGLGAKDEL